MANSEMAVELLKLVYAMARAYFGFFEQFGIRVTEITIASETSSGSPRILKYVNGNDLMHHDSRLVSKH